VPIPGTKCKRSNSIFFVTSVAHICGRVWSQLLQPLAQSLIGSPGTLGTIEGIVAERPRKKIKKILEVHAK